MILQALASYYERLLDDPDVDVAEPGFSTEKIHYEILLGPRGELRAIDNIQISPEKGSKLLPRLLKVPAPVKRTAGVAANFLWDNTGYVLGADAKGKPERAQEQFAAFRVLAHALGDGLDDDGMRAVLAFLDVWNPDEAAALPGWDDMAGLNVVFRLDGELGHVHSRPAVREAWLHHVEAKAGGGDAFCLVTGKPSSAARLHPSVKGVRGAQSSGAALVSFNLDAFTSYGKEQNYNAPVGERAAFAYTTALNHMLARGSDQKKQLGGTAEAVRHAASGDRPPPRRRVLMVGDATTVFWTEKPTQAEIDFGEFFDNPEPDDEAHDGEVMQRLRALVAAVAAGKEPPLWYGDKADTPFYILGLSPNAARLSVRFWYPSTVKVMMQRLGQHFVDLAIIPRYESEPQYPSLWKLLLETAPARKLSDGKVIRKIEDIPPIMAGQLMNAIVNDVNYPMSFLSRIASRILIEKDITTCKASIIKAYYLRRLRKYNSEQVTIKELSMGINEESTNVGYLLGRLFAVLEKIQHESADGNLNTTIRDRFYSSAATTPNNVFPRLLSLTQHHLSKMRKDEKKIGLAVIREKQLQTIAWSLDVIPSKLSLDNQNMFSLGFFHQRNALYQKKETSAAS
ncbi:MAG: type I-C CRISPR-associated protein Cas8c/Csd1 [Desulfovibrionaceae bacterium]|nr:type I-C CRISPR-associated protein Cas8c/Csd1 [Desulfovibrionaceae bacterium]